MSFCQGVRMQKEHKDKSVHITLSEEVHKRLRLLSVELNTSIVGLVRKALVEQYSLTSTTTSGGIINHNGENISPKSFKAILEDADIHSGDAIIIEASKGSIKINKKQLTY